MKLYDCGLALFLVIVGAVLVANVMTELMHEGHKPKAKPIVIQVQHHYPL